MHIIEKKGKEIDANIKDKFQSKPNYRTILKILDFLRHIMAEYLKYSYKIKQIEGDSTENRAVAIDESLISHDNDVQLLACWCIRHHNQKY